MVGVSVDSLADGTGKAGFTLISLPSTIARHPFNDSSGDNAGGWPMCDLRAWLAGMREAFDVPCIKPVTRTYELPSGTRACSDELWVPNWGMVRGIAGHNGVYQWFAAHSSNEYRKATDGRQWWTSTSSSGSDSQYIVSMSGTGERRPTTNSGTYVVACFCV